MLQSTQQFVVVQPRWGPPAQRLTKHLSSNASNPQRTSAQIARPVWTALTYDSHPRMRSPWKPQSLKPAKQLSSTTGTWKRLYTEISLSGKWDY